MSVNFYTLHICVESPWHSCTLGIYITRQSHFIPTLTNESINPALCDETSSSATLRWDMPSALKHRDSSYPHHATIGTRLSPIWLRFAHAQSPYTIRYSAFKRSVLIPSKPQLYFLDVRPATATQRQCQFVSTMFSWLFFLMPDLQHYLNRLLAFCVYLNS